MNVQTPLDTDWVLIGSGFGGSVGPQEIEGRSAGRDPGPLPEAWSMAGAVEAQAVKPA